MGRSCWKGPFIHCALLKKKNYAKRSFKVWSRDSIILSHFLNFKVLVHSGNMFKHLVVSRDKVGYKFGEFCTTHSKFFHKNKVKFQKNTKVAKSQIKKK